MNIDVTNLIAVLLANGESELISHALKCQLLPPTSEFPDNIVVSMHRNKLPNGYEFTKSDSSNYGKLPLAVLEYNPLKMKTPYLVQYPDGTQDWVQDNHYIDTTTYFKSVVAA